MICGNFYQVWVLPVTRVYLFCADYRTILCTCMHAQLPSCVTLCYPVDSSPPGSSFFGNFQAERWLGWHFLLHLPNPGMELMSPEIGRQFLYQLNHLRSITIQFIVLPFYWSKTSGNTKFFSFPDSQLVSIIWNSFYFYLNPLWASLVAQM